MEEQKNKVAADLKQNVERLKKDLGVGESFDVLVREFKVGGKGVALFFVDGFAKDDILVWVMQSLFRVMREQSAPPLVSALFQRCAIRKGLTWLQCTWAAALFMGCTHPFFWCPLFVAPSAL